MPTIAQLPPAAQALSNADLIPVDQNVGGTYQTGQTNLGALLSLLAASNMLPVSMYSGSGAPSGGTAGINGDSYVNVANGDLWQWATGSGWTKVGSLVGPAGAAGAAGPAGPSYSITEQSTVTSMAGTDLVGISQGGADHTITLANLLDGETIDQGSAAAPMSSSDTFWTGQGGSSMVVQTISALLPWLFKQWPTYFLPVIELTASTTLDASIHNGKLIICSQPITVTAGGTMGSGFSCVVINISSGTCTLSGFTTSSGSGSLTTGQSANVYVAAYSGGTVNFAAIAGGASTPPEAPGLPAGLTVGTTTATAALLSWTAPGSGGSPSSYTVQYSIHGANSWTQVSAISSTSTTITGLTPSTEYDFEVEAVNSGGNSGFTSAVQGTTPAGTAPGVPTNLAAGSPTSSSIVLSWTAPSVGSTGATYNIQYQIGSGSWTQISGVSGTSYTVTGLASSTTYNFEVQTVNSGLTSSWTSSVSASTSAANNYLLTAELPTSSLNSYAPSATVAVAINDNSTSADGSYTVPGSVGFGWSNSSTQIPASLTAASGPITTDTATGITGSLYGHNVWYQWVGAPSTAGTYYLWAIAYSGGGLTGTVEYSVVWPFTITVT